MEARCKIPNDMVFIYLTSLLPVSALWVIRLLDPEAVFPPTQSWSSTIMHKVLFLPPSCFETCHIAMHCLYLLYQRTFSGSPLPINAGYVWLMSSPIYHLFFASQIASLQGLVTMCLLLLSKTARLRGQEIEGVPQIRVE